MKISIPQINPFVIGIPDFSINNMFTDMQNIANDFKKAKEKLLNEQKSKKQKSKRK